MESIYEYEHFSSKSSFNKSLSHFQSVADILGYFEDAENIADILNDLASEGELQQNQLLPIVHALLVDKYGYYYKSYNIQDTYDDFEKIYSIVKTWNGVDIVIGYHHPELGYCVINPKDREQLESVQILKRNELLTVYTGSFENTDDDKKYVKASDLFISILQGSYKSTPASITKGTLKPTKKAPPPKKAKKAEEVKAEASESTAEAAPAAPKKSGGKKRMTPLYSVPVTNELFHNGNVEAWKKIIQSYNAKYPDLEVYIFYDGERILDIHALFKWGKVKHGSSILFAVAGEEIKEVAKLQRYLKQGASPKFEDFLRFPVNTILKLF